MRVLKAALASAGLLIALLFAAHSVRAQTTIGSNPYGGVCFGGACDPTPPSSVPSGLNAYGGACLGGACEQPNMQPNPYQGYPTVQPSMPMAPNPMYSDPVPSPYQPYR